MDALRDPAACRACLAEFKALVAIDRRALVLVIAFLIGLASPSRADDVSAAQGVIRAQEQAFSRDDAAAAYSHAAPEIRQLFPQADMFMQMVQQGYACESPPIDPACDGAVTGM